MANYNITPKETDRHNPSKVSNSQDIIIKKSLKRGLKCLKEIMKVLVHEIHIILTQVFIAIMNQQTANVWMTRRNITVSLNITSIVDSWPRVLFT